MTEPKDLQGARVAAQPRCDSDGGDALVGQPAPQASPQPTFDAARTEAEFVQLHIRVIALENLVIALLARAPAAQLDLAREMAAYISPRPGRTPHRLTLRAADEMRSLIDRATHFPAPPAA